MLAILSKLLISKAYSAVTFYGYKIDQADIIVVPRVLFLLC